MAVKLYRCFGRCNTLNDFPINVCIANKTVDLNLSMVSEMNESSCKCKPNFDGRRCNSDQKLINNKCRCECKKHNICETDCICNPARCSCENGKCLASIIDDSVITCDEIIDKDYSKKF